MLARAIHSPSSLWSPFIQQRPFPTAMLSFITINQYYGLIRLPARFLTFRLLIVRLFSMTVTLFLGLLLSAGKGLPSSPIFCLTVSPLTPRGRHKQLSNSSGYDADFVYKIKTRPPLFMIFTRLPLCSFALQPGHLRRVLSDYFVESLRINPFPALFRFLATWL